MWSHNVEKVFRELPYIVKKYPYIAMDTEFPGVVAKPVGNFISASEFHYQSLKINVDLLQIIQLGITFFDEHGNTAPNKCTYQFNFTFDICTDLYSSESISLLQNCGIDFMRHGKDGINPVQFGELLTASGLVMMDKVVFLSFHSGYDFAYLMKLLTNDRLPFDETGFFDILKIFFPNIYDVKYLMKSCKTLKGGLEEVAKQLEVPRHGPSHQAGSDSLLTGLVFFRIKELYFEDNIDEIKYSGHLFGLGISALWAPIHAHGTQLYTAEQHQSNAVAASVAVQVHQQQMLAAAGLAMPPTPAQVAAADPFLSGQLITSAPPAPAPGTTAQPTYVPTVGHVTGVTATEFLPGVIYGNEVVTCQTIPISPTGGIVQPHLASDYSASASTYPPTQGSTEHSGVTFYPTPNSARVTLSSGLQGIPRAPQLPSSALDYTSPSTTSQSVTERRFYSSGYQRTVPKTS